MKDDAEVEDENARQLRSVLLLRRRLAGFGVVKTILVVDDRWTMLGYGAILLIRRITIAFGSGSWPVFVSVVQASVDVVRVTLANPGMSQCDGRREEVSFNRTQSGCRR